METTGRSGTEESVDEVTDTSQEAENWTKIAEKNGTGKIKLTKGDVVRFRSEEREPWKYGMIDSRIPKTAQSSSRNCFNIEQDEVEDTTEVNLELCDVEKQVNLLENCETFTFFSEDAESIYIMDDEDKIEDKEEQEAKDQEIQKLQDFGVYQEVNDNGQSFVSSRWVFTKRKNKVKARLVARGFEEIGGFQKDSPTVSNSSMRLMYTLSASHD